MPVGPLRQGYSESRRRDGRADTVGLRAVRFLTHAVMEGATGTRRFTAKVTSKGQLTLPIEVRRTPGIEPGDRVSIVVDDGAGARLHRIEHPVDSVRGLIPAPRWLAGRDLDEMIEEATLAHADEVVRRMRANAS